VETWWDIPITPIILEKVIHMYYNINNSIKEIDMPKKNSLSKPVHSFRLSLECVRQLKDLAGNMGRSEGDVVEVAVDRMYREELRFGNLMINEGKKPEEIYKVEKKKE
jgi:predicted DNA-binding protein